MTAAVLWTQVSRLKRPAMIEMRASGRVISTWGPWALIFTDSVHIHPNIESSDLGSIIDTIENCKKTPVHQRAPYGDSLVVCAFSGSHQEAIKKGFSAACLGRELLAKEITDLFEETYFLTENPRFSIVDYSVTTDRSRSPAPVAPSKIPVTKHLMRVFNGVISFDGKKLKLQSRSNGPISGLANATRMWYRAH
ncbi:uncharacterized protein TRIVIDRAFT_66894 [Trichoderma virens Gv29-8]|uniref:Uncharacterized protein n=1 Tax=Hypocrea virens (strain Gv29-8 / FGSC 10586) TaxID=413071 RepID=G9N3I4_HYPVG|nr:uncharacterized protein TRIVIDRAFT_66894 [Trichoderma virens Gv29-8]EHK18868.1 hypothetical protein TRIVIDRAFT_66894 [Trichoderma virens Gv29-8]